MRSHFLQTDFFLKKKCVFGDGQVTAQVEGRRTGAPESVVLGVPEKHGHGHTSDVTTVCWDPSEPGRLASASDDCSILLWDLDRGSSPEPLSTSGGHMESFSAAGG